MAKHACFFDKGCYPTTVVSTEWVHHRNGLPCGCNDSAHFRFRKRCEPRTDFDPALTRDKSHVCFAGAGHRNATSTSWAWQASQRTSRGWVHGPQSELSILKCPVKSFPLAIYVCCVIAWDASGRDVSIPSI